MLLILILPLLSAIILGLFGRCIGYKGGKIISSTIILLNFFLSLYLIINVFFYNGSFILIGPSYIHSLNCSFILLFDSLSTIMVIIINTIALAVLLYSNSYMNQDPHLIRFLSLINLFIFFMLFLVLSNNLILLFIGWEGIGVISYLLISFWYTRLEAIKSAFKALLLNRIGDVGLTISIIGIYSLLNSVDYNIIYISLKPYDSIIIFGLILATMGKSAQLGLHTWLYSAMEGPTPVSALLHAATLVTAGVYLNIKLNSIFFISPWALKWYVLLGAFTTLFGGLMGIITFDIKKIIAFSTMSQIGLIILNFGLSNYSFSLFHLFNHSFVKALLFLCSGVLIHNYYHQQDIRYLKSSPLISICLLLSSLSLAAFPFLSCFYSKDTIILSTQGIILIFTIGSSLCTVIYSFKIFLNTLSLTTFSSLSLFLFLPILLLIIPSLIIGYITATFFNSFTFKDSLLYTVMETEFINSTFKLLPIFICFLGLFLISFKLKGNWIENKAYFDYIYNKLTLKDLGLYKHLDRGILEILGSYGLSNLVKSTSLFFCFLSTSFLILFIILFLWIL